MLVMASGYFNPLHKGHIKYLRLAKLLGYLVVVVNNDLQVKLKGSKPFMDEEERVSIIRNLKCVDMAIVSQSEDKTVNIDLELIKPDVFVKGGDSTSRNTPEVKLCKKLGIKVIFGVGGKKIQSSRWLKSAGDIS
jgi:cytidyltransferase-like protein